MMIAVKPRHLLLSGLLLSASALAWVPALNLKTAATIVNSAYGRIAPVKTSLTLNLQVKGGAFAAGPGAVSLFSGPKTCLTDWIKHPTDYAAYGSRPTSIALAGQGNYVLLQAQTARNNFANITPAAALAKAKAALPDGTLRIFVSIAGLPHKFERNAYNVALLGPKRQILHPKQISYVSGTWKKASNGLWGGTMIYAFDLANMPNLDPLGNLTILLRTEAANSCAYEFQADLAKFI
jgi:hypothetical protein